MALPPTPSIIWNTGFSTTWIFPGPIDNPIPSANFIGAVAESDSGIRDYWETRTDDELSFAVRFIPKQIVSGVTGFSDTAGAYAALKWLFKQNVGRFCPNKDTPAVYIPFYLLEYTADREKGGTHYRVDMKIRSSDGTQFLGHY